MYRNAEKALHAPLPPAGSALLAKQEERMHLASVEKLWSKCAESHLHREIRTAGVARPGGRACMPRASQCPRPSQCYRTPKCPTTPRSPPEQREELASWQRELLHGDGIHAANPGITQMSQCAAPRIWSSSDGRFLPSPVGSWHMPRRCTQLNTKNVA